MFKKSSETKTYGYLRKSKAYGLVSVLAFGGLALSAQAVSADEVNHSTEVKSNETVNEEAIGTNTVVSTVTESEATPNVSLAVETTVEGPATSTGVEELKENSISSRVEPTPETKVESNLETPAKESEEVETVKPVNEVTPQPTTYNTGRVSFRAGGDDRINFANRQAVDKIENTQTPSNKPDADGSYNSQIKSIEVVERSEDTVKLKVSLHDGYVLNSGSFLRLYLQSGWGLLSHDIYNENNEKSFQVETELASNAKSYFTREFLSALENSTTVTEFRDKVSEFTVDKSLNHRVYRFVPTSLMLNKNKGRVFTLTFKRQDLRLPLPNVYKVNRVINYATEGLIGSTHVSDSLNVSDVKLVLPSVADKTIKFGGTKLFYNVSSEPKIKLTDDVRYRLNLSVGGSSPYLTNVSSSFSWSNVLELYSNEGFGVYHRREDSWVKAGDKVQITVPKDGLLDFDLTGLEVGSEFNLPTLFKKPNTEQLQGNRFTDTDYYKVYLIDKDVSHNGFVKARIVDKVADGFTVQFLEDLSTTSNGFSNVSFTRILKSMPVKLKDNWLSLLSDDSSSKLKQALQKGINRVRLSSKSGSPIYSVEVKRGSERLSGVDGYVSLDLIVNRSLGESTVGTVKVKYLNDKGVEISPEETVAKDKPWNEVVTVTPKTIPNYTYVSSSTPLQTLVGSGETIITLTYKSTEKRYIPDPDLPHGKQEDDGNGKVRVGTKPTTRTVSVPFETKYQDDPKLPKGQEKVLQEGKAGSETYTTTYTVDPKTGATTPKEEKTATTPKTDKLIARGTGENITESVKLVYKPNPELPAGEIGKVLEEGKPRITDVTGKVIEQGKTRVIEIGTKTQIREEEGDPYKTEERPNPNLPKGQTKEIQKGINGKKVTTTTYTLDNPNAGLVTPHESVVVTPPTNRIIEVGTGEDKDGDVEVQYIPDPEGENGKTTTVTEGIPPRYDVTGKKISNGTPKVVKVGTKPKVEETPIPFSEGITQNPSKPEGTRTVLKEGKSGKKVTATTYKVDPKTGKVTLNRLTVATVPPENALVEVGTGKNITGGIVTEYVPDDGLDVGKTEVKKVGEPEVRDVTGKVLKPGTPTVVRIGTKPKVREEDGGDFDTIYRDNPQLPKGEEKEIQKGIKGKRTITTTYTVDPKTGKVTPHENTVETPATPRIVERGTGIPTVGDVEVVYVPDGDLDNGQTKVVDEGQPKITDVGGKVTQEGRPRVIHVGTKIKVEVEEDPTLKEVERENPELPKGERKVVQEGRKGKKTTTTTYTVDPKTGKVTPNTTVSVDEGEPRITEVGTKEPTKPVEDTRITARFVDKDGNVLGEEKVEKDFEPYPTYKDKYVYTGEMKERDGGKTRDYVYELKKDEGEKPTEKDHSGNGHRVDQPTQPASTGSTVSTKALPSTGTDTQVSASLATLGLVGITTLIGVGSLKRKEEE